VSGHAALPPAWEWATLGFIADVRLGKMLSPAAYADGLEQKPYLRNENVRWGRLDISDVKSMGFKPTEIDRYGVEPGDLLICEGGEPGRCAVYTGPPGLFMYQKALHRVRSRSSEVYAKYLQALLQHYAASGTGFPRASETTIQHLPLEKMLVLPVPLPPAPEQRRIVAAIEEQFTRLDAAVASLQRARANLKRYRAALLRSAVEGRLIIRESKKAVGRGENDNFSKLPQESLACPQTSQSAALGPSRSAGKRAVNFAISPDLPQLPATWTWVRLAMIADVRLGKMLSRAAFEPGLRQLAYLRNENVRWGFVDLTDVKLMGFRESEVERYAVQQGDLLVCEGGEPGRCAIFTGTQRDLMYQKALHRIRPHREIADAHYLQLCLEHYIRSRSLFPRASETTIQHLPLERIVALPIPLPPLAEQLEIVAEVERRMSGLEQSAAAVEANLKRTERLRQAILKRAFEGKLVPQNPTDEPATALLERIRAERASTNATARQPRRSSARVKRANKIIQKPMPL
jgi:type I restriction enzyme S subunit